MLHLSHFESLDALIILNEFLTKFEQTIMTSCNK